MARVRFNVGCMAIYQSELDIPDEIKDNDEAVLAYIHSHLDDCSVEDLEWWSDLEPDKAVTLSDIRYIE